MRVFILGQAITAFGVVLLLVSCGGGSDEKCSNCAQGGGGVEVLSDTDLALRSLINQRGLTGDPVPASLSIPPKPSHSNLTKLGQTLFFSKSLSLDFDTACASCHFPNAELGTGDGLSLSVGVSAKDRNALGPGRVIDPSSDLDPKADALPNVPRNSQSIINSAIYQKALFWDGRVQRYKEGILTPDSIDSIDPDAGPSLLTAQARFPLVSPNEMRGYAHVALATNEEIREYLVKRLRGEVDKDRVTSEDSANWLEAFILASDEGGFSGEGAGDLITMDNIASAISAYEKSLILVDSTWKRYVAEKELYALTDEAKRGALRFLTDLGQPIYDGAPDDAVGLGCASCHSGDFFTDESFHNVGFPQIGRGKRATREDFGRYAVTQNTADKYKFRTPNLHNVISSEPYGHAGTFATLSDLLIYHADPAIQAEGGFDYSLQNLPQFVGEAITSCEDGSVVPYCDAKEFTFNALKHPSFTESKSLLPMRMLTETELADLVSFFNALTDPCVLDSSCLDDWVPSVSDGDPDGNMLVINQQSSDEDENLDEGSDGGNEPGSITLNFPPSLPVLNGFADAGEECKDKNNISSTIKGSTNFTVVDAELSGLSAQHGFTIETWSQAPNATIQAGGVAVGYLDADCWPDILYAGGDKSGLVSYINNGNGHFYNDQSVLPEELGGKFASLGIADINGDYRRELFLGNLMAGDVYILAKNGSGHYVEAASLPMGRNTFGFAFADIGSDLTQGYPSILLAHWDVSGLPGTAPAIFANVGGDTLLPSDAELGLGTADGLSQNFQFSPGFADINGDGYSDILIASDFGTSVVLGNEKNENENGSRHFNNYTDRDVIRDQNGMGAAIADFDNDQDLDWFVNSIAYIDDGGEIYKGSLGNRLYRNDSANERIQFSDVTDQAGVADGGWAWGACAADFNNDGLIDIFHETGYSYYPDEIYMAASQEEKKQIDDQRETNAQFISTPARLFINQGGGVFSDTASQWGIDQETDGRGVACFDYDRDGTVDILVLDHSRQLKIYKNNLNAAEGRHFLNIRLQGAPPNTEALGAKVFVTARLSSVSDEVTQFRESAANSNFASQNLPDLHFGLGAALSADVKIVWPNGEVETYTNVTHNQFVTYRQQH